MKIKNTTYWFFIRGLMREAAHWEDFPKQFETAFPESKVVTLDLQGSGAHWNSKAPLTILEMAESVRQQAQNWIVAETTKTGKIPKCYVLAISLGGMVALEWLQKFPEDLKGGVFINISLSGINSFYERLKPRAWIPLAKIIFTRDVVLRERKVLELTTSNFQVKDSLLKKRDEVFRKHPANRLNFLRQLIAASRFKVPKQNVKRPILLLNSAGDRLVDSSCSEKIHKKWNWELKTHPTANHDLPLDDPNWVLDKIKSWVVRIED